MAIGNGSGREVEYDVQPSDPGGGGGGNIVDDPVKYSLISTSLGSLFVGVGCLTRFGGTGLVLAGLGLLATGLVFQGIALPAFRRIAAAGGAAGVAPLGGTVLKNLAPGEEHLHTFAPGTWVNFWDPATRTKLAQSPAIEEQEARAVLRRCVCGPVAASDQGQALGVTSAVQLTYFVEVT